MSTTYSKLLKTSNTIPQNVNIGQGTTLSKLNTGIYNTQKIESYNNGGFFGGLGYFFEKIGLGFMQGIEGIWDYAAGGLADLFGADEWAEQQFANDWVNYNDADEWYNPSGGWKVAGDVASGIGTSLPTLLAAAGTAVAIYYSGGTASGGAAAFWASYGPAVVGSIVGGVSAAGQSTKEAYKETGELGWKEYGYGALSGLAEAGLEFASAGIGAGTGRLLKEMGKGAAKGVAKGVAEGALKGTAKTITAKAITTGLLKDFASEAFEEGVQEILDPYFKRWTGVDPDAENATAQQVGYAALVGGLAGVLMGGAGNLVNTGASHVSDIRKGNRISQNPEVLNSVIDYARKAAAYETEHNTGEPIYQRAKSLIEQYDALTISEPIETTTDSTPDTAQPEAESGQADTAIPSIPNPLPKLTLGMKKLIGQLSDVSVGLTFSGPVKRSRDKILANPEAFIKIINERNILDGTTGKPFHFNSVEELLQNEDLLTQFAVGDALGEFMLRKDSAYDYIMGKKNTGLTQEEFRLFQKEGSAAHKKGVSEVYGVDVDSITYEDFIEKMKTTSRQAIESKQTGMRLRNQAKKAIAKAINEKQDVADIKTYDRKSNIENGTTVYKVTENEYISVIKDADGFYVYAGGNISVKLNRKQLNSFIVQLKKAAKGITSQTSQAAAQTTPNAAQPVTNAENTVNVEQVSENVTPASVNQETQSNTQPVVEAAEEVAATTTQQVQETAVMDEDTKAQKIKELIDAEDNVPANVLGHLLENKTVDIEKVFSDNYSSDMLSGVEHFAASESDYVRQRKFSAKALAQAISENAEEINAAYKNNRLPTELKVKVWDRAFEIDGKELPAWYKEQYHAQETTSETATAAEPAETTAKKSTRKKATLEKAKENLIKLHIDSSRNVKGAAVKDGKQYIINGVFAVRYNTVSDALTKHDGTDYPFALADKVIKEASETANQQSLVKVDADQLRQLIPTKKSEYIQTYAKIGDFYYQVHYLSRVLDAMTNPEIYVKPLDSKGGFNNLYIKADNGEAVLLPMRIEGGKATPVYTAGYASRTTETASTATDTKKQPIKKKTVKTENVEQNTTETKKLESIDSKSYKEFSVEEFNALPEMLRNYYLAKSKKPNAIIALQMGDFYEILGKDAKIAAKELDLTLTARSVKSIENRVEIVGYQIKDADTNVKKLTDKGYDVVTVDSKGVKVFHKAKTETAAQTTEKTAKKKTTKKKTEDFGEKIGGARKDEWTKRGLSASDIAEMNQREIERHVKKENVWKRPNFVEAVANGGNRGLLYAQNEIFKSLNTRPYLRYTRNATVEQITDNAKRYADEVKAIQNIAESIKTKDDIVSIGFRWGIEQGYIKVEQNSAGYTYTEKYYDSPALYGSDFLGTLLKLRRKFDSLETIAMREGFGVAPENKLPKGYEIHEKTDWQGRGQGSFYIVKGRYIVLDGFTSYEQALTAGKERFGTAATSKTEKNGKKRFIPPQLKDVHREGLDYRSGKNVTGDDFLKDFQIKGGEFGNWLTESDRTESLNYAYDAFCDLADALNIEMSDIALQKTLSIGFGSRGQGLSGAVAHYEPDRKVINLTKMNGAGSLGHEWWHAFEDYITGSTSQSEMSSDFSNLPEKTRAAAKELVAKMNYKDGKISADEQNANNAKHLDRYNRILESQLKQHFTLFAADMDESTRASTAERYRYKRTPTQEDIAKLEALKKKAFEGDAQILAKFQTGAPNIIDEISELRKEVTGRGISKEDRSGLVSLVDRIAYYKTVVTEEKTVRVKTDYYNNAVLISQQYSKDGGYWDSNAEMLARAFASYITDKTGGKNDYLSGHSENPMPIVNKDGSLGVAYAMPVGEERIVINEAFDKLFAAAKEDGLISDAKRTKPTTTSRYAVSEVTDLNNQPNGSKSQKIAPLQMKRAESVARQNIKGYENLTEAEKLEVEWTLASSWSCGVDNAEAIRLAQISAELGTGIGFANISQPSKNGKTYFIDGVCYTRGEHSTIYLDPKNANNVETIVLEELTHAFEKTEGYSTLREMADKYYAEHTDEKEAIEKTYRDFYAKENVRFAEEILPSELTAHYVREVLGKRSMIAELTKESPKTTKGILGWLKAIKNRIKKADTSATAVSDVELLENRFKSVYNQYRNRTSSVTAADSSRMSIADVNGKPTVIVDTDQHIFEGVDKSKMGAVVQKYMQARYRGKTINETVFTRRSELEYTYSRDTQRLYNENSSAYEAKMRASTELDNLIITGELIATETPKHVKPINEGGIKRYKVEFVVGDGVFNGELLIAVDKKGVNSFYDIVKIKESNKSNISPNAEVRTNALSNSIIRHSLQNVNTSGEISTDSQGNSLTAEQQSFFKDSKVVDKDGKLLVVYHGTSNYEEIDTWNEKRKSWDTEYKEFTIFKNDGYDGNVGFFFSKDIDNAGGYGNRLYEVYLNIKNPLVIDCKGYSYSYIEHNGEFHDTYEWAKYAKQKGYDGVIFKNVRDGVDYGAMQTPTDEYVVFKSNQIKFTSNATPTTNTDIRYALRSEDVSGSDRVMSSLPNDRVSVRDVITKKKTRAQLTEQVKGDTRQYAEGFQIAMTNAQAGLERVMRQAGIEDATSLTNYVRAAKYAGNNALEVDGGQYNLTGETRLGDSWGKIWQPIYKLDAKDGNAYVNFQTYLLHWHNIDRMAVGKPVFGENVTAADSQAAIAKLEEAYPTFRKTAEKVWKFLDNNLQLSVDSGMYSQEYVDSLREMYPHYVPTYREEHSNSVAAIVGKNNVRVSINKMKASGSDLRILPIDDVVASQTIQKYSSARINDLLIKILDGKKHDEFSVMSSEDADIDIDTETLVTTYEDKAKNKHQITFYKGGKRITAEVSQNLYRGVEAFMPSGDQSFNNILLNGFAKVNSLFKKLVTSWNPFFSYFRNPIRDIQDAGLYTRYPIKTFAKNYGRARTEIQNNGKYWQEAKAAGISAASVYDYEKGLNYKKDKNVVKKIGAKLEAGSNTIEMTPRLAEYISAREAGLSVQEALLQAQDVTTNFGRGGVFAKKLNATIMPFLNPAIQGFSKMTRAYMGKDAAQSWINLIVRSVLLGIGMTALNDLLNDDDEDYENLSDYVKENNYVIGIGDGNFIKIPKGRVVSVFGGAFLRSKWYMEGDEKAFEGYLSNIASQVTPVDNFSRTIFSPITDLATNTTWYGGTIEGQKWDDTQPKDRYDETTSSIAIWLGQVFNYSPTKIDYLLEQYGGIVTDVVLPATTLQAEKGIVTQNLLVNSTTNSRWSTEFYEQKEDYTYKKTAGDNAAKGVVKYLNGVNSTISNMSKQKREIHADKSLSNDEKLKQANVIQAAINALEKDSLTNAKYLYEELKKYGEYGDLSDEDYFDRAYLDAVSVVIGEEYALKSYNKKVYEKAQSLNTLGISYGFYYDYYFATKAIETEYKSNGTVITGSKKSSIINFTMSQNLLLPQKLILLMSAGYTIKDGDIRGVSKKYAQKTVAKYIQGLQIPLKEKIRLCELCGLTVKNGRVIYK